MQSDFAHAVARPLPYERSARIERIEQAPMNGGVAAACASSTWLTC